MLNVSALAVIQLLKPESFSVEVFEHRVDPMLHVDVVVSRCG
tara:strand:- start:83 stop:208 length:126 start_codon:yes stop_codon:yes gene_type:complete